MFDIRAFVLGRTEDEHKILLCDIKYPLLLDLTEERPQTKRSSRLSII